MTEKNLNQQFGVPLGIYQERYGALDPEEASRRTGVPFDAASALTRLYSVGYINAAWRNLR